MTQTSPFFDTDVNVDEIDTPILRTPSNQHVRWLEYKTICRPGSCGSAAYIKVNGEALCLMHAFRAVCELLNQYAPYE